MPPRRAAFLIFCVSLLAYGYFVYRGPHHNPDSRLALTYSLVERGTLAVDDYAGTTRDLAYARGHYYTDKAPGLSFALAPLYLGLRLVIPPDGPAAQWLYGEDRFLVRHLLTFLGIGIPAAAFNALLFHWLRRLEPRVGPRLAVTLGYALGSPAYPFAVSAFGHVPAGICLFGAFAAIVSRRRVLLAGLLLGLAIGIEYPVVVATIPIAALAIARAWRARWRAAGALALGALLPLAALAAYHWAAFGAPWQPGYAHLAPGSDFAGGQAQGLLGVGLPDLRVALALLLGPHRGLFVHAPWLILAVVGSFRLLRCDSARPRAAASLAVFVALLLVNSGYAFWNGGASWGPRHLVPSLPFLTFLALPAAARWPKTAWPLIGVSVFITIAAVATGPLPGPDVAVPIRDALLPDTLAGHVANNWGQLLGLSAWRGLVPALAMAGILALWLTGWRRWAGVAVAAAWALVAIARLDRRYLDYSEGYFLYLGARLADGAALYADTASTQPPLLPLVIGLLWRIQPDVVLPRLLAIGCYLATAVLAGRLARKITGDGPGATLASVLATAIAAVLPLGAGAPMLLDANAVLAPLAVILALVWWRIDLPIRASPRSRACASRLGWAALAGIVAAAGLSVKLTFALFALAPLAAVLLFGRHAPRGDRYELLASALSYTGTALLVGALHLALWTLVAGRAVLDGFIGELESPMMLAGALLAVVQFVQLENVALALAISGWWVARRRGAPAALLVFGIAAAAMALHAVHYGTFVGVARPAEPFIAAFAAVGLLAVADTIHRWLRRTRRMHADELRFEHLPALPFNVYRRAWTVAVLAAVTLAFPGAISLSTLLWPETVDPAPVLGALQAAGQGDVLAPPYYAALAGRRTLFDYADWTVWGMRSAARRGLEHALEAQAASILDRREVPLVAADFRLRHLPAVQRALERSYVALWTDGDVPARSITLYAPR
ncbi:MAG: DUF2029 domain-containing protein [Chloroflexi bacterium]|nr:DUF2029 domain-containing protein [Chloroflexota bacterium]